MGSRSIKGWDPIQESDEERLEQERTSQENSPLSLLVAGCLIGLVSLGACYGAIGGGMIGMIARNQYQIKKFSQEADAHSVYSIKLGAKVGSIGFASGLVGLFAFGASVDSRFKKRTEKYMAK